MDIVMFGFGYKTREQGYHYSLTGLTVIYFRMITSLHCWWRELLDGRQPKMSTREHRQTQSEHLHHRHLLIADCSRRPLQIDCCDLQLDSRLLPFPSRFTP